MPTSTCTTWARAASRTTLTSTSPSRWTSRHWARRPWGTGGTPTGRCSTRTSPAGTPWPPRSACRARGSGNADSSPFFGGVSRYTHQQIADGYSFDRDFAGQARSAFALNGTGTVLFEVRGQSDDWGQKQLVQLVQVVLAGVLGMAERMADGSVDTLNGDDFYPRTNRSRPPTPITQSRPWIRVQCRWLPSWHIPHRHCSRAELQPAHELQVDMLR
jgi:hypothetical protein